jgi:toxin-antitoxin system protein
METIVERKQTSFRLRTDLLKRMEKEASKENRSLNDFVEGILMDSLYFQPNETTLAAMREAESGVELEELDVDNFIEYVKSL